MDDPVIYVFGVIVTFFVFRWLFQRPTSSGQRNIPIERLSQEQLGRDLQRLGEIFPTLDAQIIRESLIRAGNLEGALDALLRQQPHLVTGDTRSLSQETQTSILVAKSQQRVSEMQNSLDTADSESLRCWSSTAEQRQRNLDMRKALMLDAAKKKLLNGQ